MPELLLASGNAGKAREIAALLEGSHVLGDLLECAFQKVRLDVDGRSCGSAIPVHSVAEIEKGVVDGAKVTFQVQQPEGPLRSFTLTHVKDRLQGTQKLEFKEQTAEVTVDAERAK